MNPARVLILLLAGGLFLLACRRTEPVRLGGLGASATAAPPPVFFPEKLAEMDSAILGSIASNQIPGGVLWLERGGQAHTGAYGQRAKVPQPEPMTLETIFDAASLTKVVVTAPAIMILAERGQLQLDTPVARYLPEFGVHEKEAITLRHLLTHTSGLRAGLSLRPAWSGYEAAIALACAEKPAAPPGQRFRYSDINFILLGEVVRRVAGQPLDEFAARHIFQPLGMNESGFRPAPAALPRVAPTERTGTEVLRGQVHDGTARAMGGVAGHAGLFTTAADLARFARCLLNDGQGSGGRLFSPESARAMRTVQTAAETGARRGLGWDIDSPYAGARGRHFPIGSFGHTGWTGPSLWIDPHSGSFVIFLCNRNHPDESGSVLPLRSRLGTLAAESIRGFNFAHVPGALPAAPGARPPEARPAGPVLNGIDVLRRDRFARLRGLKIGLVTNHTGTDRERRSTIDLLHQAEGVELRALFSPEHGLRGLLDEAVGDGRDEKTGLPIHSLYGERRAPAAEQLAELDALVFDIQDIGCRFYTYISTMGHCLEAAARAGREFIVLDRVNPIGGVTVEGPVLHGERSFTGWHEIPVRHGMTMGELARMFNEERALQARLSVIPVEGWQRSMLFDQTGLPWINPSPNMRNLSQALLYPGIGLLETTALSVGRGTDSPFALLGAPYIDDLKLAEELNRAGLPGIGFVPVQFTPTASVYQGQLCRGVNIILWDRERCPIVEAGVAIAAKLRELYPAEFSLEKYNRLLVHPPTIEALRDQKPWGQIRNLWQEQLNLFRARREKYLLYQ